MRGAFQPYRDVTEFGKHLEVAAGPAAETCRHLAVPLSIGR
jgi:hypothetical protein